MRFLFRKKKQDKIIELKPYLKIVTSAKYYGICAIYEPHPFRNCAIKSAVEQSGHTMNGHTGVDDDAWCWCFYDWCANCVGYSYDMPEGEIVDKFTADIFWGHKHIADHLNKDNEEFAKEWYRRRDNGKKSKMQNLWYRIRHKLGL